VRLGEEEGWFTASHRIQAAEVHGHLLVALRPAQHIQFSASGLAHPAQRGISRDCEQPTCCSDAIRVIQPATTFFVEMAWMRCWKSPDMYRL
jgi:hypothetical protein